MNDDRGRSESGVSTEPLIVITDNHDSMINDNANLNSNRHPRSNDSRAEYELLTEQSVLLIEDGILCRDIGHKMRTLQQIQIYRYISGL